jgi:hypothetical protein
MKKRGSGNVAKANCNIERGKFYLLEIPSTRIAIVLTSTEKLNYKLHLFAHRLTKWISQTAWLYQKQCNVVSSNLNSPKKLWD